MLLICFALTTGPGPLSTTLNKRVFSKITDSDKWSTLICPLLKNKEKDITFYKPMIYRRTCIKTIKCATTPHVSGKMEINTHEIIYT